MTTLHELSEELRNRIRELAYLMWESAGRQQGMALEYWVAAEREILATAKAATGMITGQVGAAPKGEEQPPAPAETPAEAKPEAKAEATAQAAPAVAVTPQPAPEAKPEPKAETAPAEQPTAAAAPAAKEETKEEAAPTKPRRRTTASRTTSKG